ncbi:rhamnan synthesis F family protein [Acidisoma silvae]|uniref:Class I SAM-dependent methyltransferase n=1 Tax=Acidisoma silvae TaxID=2802396 RepID=A0A963YY64_9PROT|nr:rhamnan synthesis F family protein [Acidisoma silvae]MCB8878378.1 class I SAM-dependent methyltransferase [Acidisoma silvae]
MNFDSDAGSAHPLSDVLAESALDSVFWTPSRIGAMSAWWGHVPFAHWIISALQPVSVVELGTHNGVSFAAFCEAMQRNALPGRCYAVDSWEGDEQAGWYGEEVFANLATFVQARYAAFAEMLRMRFDKALPYFSDGSIDLLHIDGLHTYDAVKNDFETWLPKLSAKGVILFHDTNVREGDFGVWKLWEELRQRYPSFEFLHAHGLGVLAVGSDVPRAVLDLCASPPEAAAAIRERLSQLGARWVIGEQARELTQHAKNLENERANLQQVQAVISQSLDDYKKHAANLEAERAKTTHRVDELSKELDIRAGDVRAVQQRLVAAERQLSAAERQRMAVLDEHNAELNAARQAAATNERLAHELSAAVQTLQVSTSWKVTRPLRAAKKLSARLRGRPAEPSLAAVLVTEKGPEAIGVIAQSGLFDEAFYAGTDAAKAMGISPIEHYLQQGEALGLAPSTSFDPVFYKARNPDLVGQVANLLLHYVASGRREGREAISAASTLDMPTDRLRSDRQTVVVIVHEATRTGAPILGWNIIGELKKRYNVVVLLRKTGPIAEALDEQSDGMVTLPGNFVFHDAQTDALAAALIQRYAPVYVIANSIESRYFVPSFERAGVPTVALIHEFSSSVRPLGAMHGLFESASKVVFSAHVVAESALADYHILRAREFEVLPQGASKLPPGGQVATGEQRKIPMKDIAPLPGDDGSLLVVGIGTITTRKGVEFFIAAAARVQRENPARAIQFLWIGDAYWFDEPYLESLKEQIKRSGITTAFAFAGEFEDLAAVYERADLFFLSSRLDPLPNVTIDAALHGIPVICFDQASGCAEILVTSPATRDLVVPYMDVEAAASLVLALSADQARLAALAQGMRAIAAEHFDMARYVESLDRCGLAGVAAHKQAILDAETLSHEDNFNARLYLGSRVATMTRTEAIAHYLHGSHLAAPRGRPDTGHLVRRPLEGFHPMIYAERCSSFDEKAGEDPLVHYLRAGRPSGPWQHQIIRPTASTAAAPAGLRVAVHGHFHYPELLEDFIVRLRRNRTMPDLILTTTSDDAAAELKSILARMKFANATITIAPNRGRDIAPMLTSFGVEHFANYDLVGHVHGKRSPHVDVTVGAAWRNFAWENLVGGEWAMMDTILAAMVTDPALGLVFPEDPHLNAWDKNRDIADDLASRMGLAKPLPNHFDFPIGTMFWARPAALQSLQQLGIGWDDFPPEPLPIDGSMLHALERLLPFSAAKAGYRYAATMVEGCYR